MTSHSICSIREIRRQAEGSSTRDYKLPRGTTTSTSSGCDVVVEVEGLGEGGEDELSAISKVLGEAAALVGMAAAGDVEIGATDGFGGRKVVPADDDTRWQDLAKGSQHRDDVSLRRRPQSYRFVLPLTHLLVVVFVFFVVVVFLLGFVFLSFFLWGRFWGVAWRIVFRGFRGSGSCLGLALLGEGFEAAVRLASDLAASCRWCVRREEGLVGLPLLAGFCKGNAVVLRSQRGFQGRAPCFARSKEALEFPDPAPERRDFVLLKQIAHERWLAHLRHVLIVVVVVVKEVWGRRLVVEEIRHGSSARHIKSVKTGTVPEQQTAEDVWLMKPDKKKRNKKHSLMTKPKRMLFMAACVPVREELAVAVSLYSHRLQHTGRPTHFYAVRIPDPAIHQKVTAVQRHLIAQDASLKTCLVSPGRLHVTLGVVRLTEATLEDAKAVVPRAAQRASAVSCSLPGLGSFGTRVLFARVDGLHDLARCVHEEIRGALNQPQPEFNAHATIAKTSKARGRRSIRQHTFQDLLDQDLGSFHATSIDLLAMSGSGPDGYYPVLATAPLLAL